MRTLFLDCFSGISGDMTVGALCDLGVQPSAFEWELAKVDIGDFHLHFERDRRQGISGVKFGVHSGAVHTHDQDEPADPVERQSASRSSARDREAAGLGSGHRLASGLSNRRTSRLTSTAMAMRNSQLPAVAWEMWNCWKPI